MSVTWLAGPYRVTDIEVTAHEIEPGGDREYVFTWVNPECEYVRVSIQMLDSLVKIPWEMKEVWRDDYTSVFQRLDMTTPHQITIRKTYLELVKQ